MDFRIVVVVIVYALVVVLLPKQYDVARLLNHLRTIDPMIVFVASAIVTALSGLGSYILLRRPNGLMYTHPTRILAVVRMGLVGGFVAGVLNVVFWLAGETPDVVMLVLIPLAFVIGEAAYLLLEWRLNRPPED